MSAHTLPLTDVLSIARESLMPDSTPDPVPLLGPGDPPLALPDPKTGRLKDRLVRFVAENITPYATVVIQRKRSGPVVTIGQGRFHCVSRIVLFWNRAAIAIQNGGSVSHIKIQISPQEFLALVARGERVRRAVEWQRCQEDLADQLDSLHGSLTARHGPTGFGASTIFADGEPVIDINPHGLHTIMSDHVDRQAWIAGVGKRTWQQHYAVTFGTTDEKAIFCAALDEAILAALKRRRDRARFHKDLEELISRLHGKLIVTGNYGEYSVINDGVGAFGARQTESGGVVLSEFIKPSERPHVAPAWKKTYDVRARERHWLLRILKRAVLTHNQQLEAEGAQIS